jgi:hypothetical protein
MAHSDHMCRIGKKGRRPALIRGGTCQKLYATTQPDAVTPIPF